MRISERPPHAPQLAIVPAHLHATATAASRFFNSRQRPPDRSGARFAGGGTKRFSTSNGLYHKEFKSEDYDPTWLKLNAAIAKATGS